jgi:transcriptional regulator with XRE-family HTH domain
MNEPGMATGLGERIRDARRAIGLTQAQLAAAVGVTRSAVAQWETGRAGQVGANLARVAAALGVSAEHLLSGGAGAAGPRGGESAGELALLRLYRELGEEDRQVILRLAIRLARRGGAPDSREESPE